VESGGTPISVTSAGPSPPASAFLDLDGLRVRYLARGAGSPLLLLHGWGGRLENFAGLVSHLGGTHAICAFDFPGFGESSVPPPSWGLGDYVALTRALMRARGLERPDVVAHSFGGRVAIRMAAEHPDEVGRLVLVGTPGLRRRRTVGATLRVGVAKAAKLAATCGGPPGGRLRDWVYGLVASTDYRRAGPLKDVFVRIVNEDLRALLPRVRARTLLVWGADDREVPLATARAMQAAMPDASLAVIAHAGHFCFLDQPEYFRLLVAKFLR
jgi:pimeloyl-ACP methyl ester carboxylesterase